MDFLDLDDGSSAALVSGRGLFVAPPESDPAAVGATPSPPDLLFTARRLLPGFGSGPAPCAPGPDPARCRIAGLAGRCGSARQICARSSRPRPGLRRLRPLGSRCRFPSTDPHAGAERAATGPPRRRPARPGHRVGIGQQVSVAADGPGDARVPEPPLKRRHAGASRSSGLASLMAPICAPVVRLTTYFSAQTMC